MKFRAGDIVVYTPPASHYQPRMGMVVSREHGDENEDNLFCYVRFVDGKVSVINSTYLRVVQSSEEEGIIEP